MYINNVCEDSMCEYYWVLQVVDMLQSLYTSFDSLCDTIDVYKVRLQPITK